ncbi:hypothetical protein [Saccharibacillus alkalitolerans]|uniref:hypothetical protein n=1 Tax=Saccharibacillus alkalitolerans TaxID=2705290 RepID=UPI00140A6FDB|nr:hypothetical protein [Saccharibacillus alkalitolerans]
MSNNHDGKHSSSKLSTIASKVLQDKEADKKEKSLAGSVLSQSEIHRDGEDSDEKSK